MKRMRRLSLLLLGCWLVLLPAQAQIDEYVAKAGLLFNLARFVDWPQGHDRIEICVLGNDPFGGVLDKYQGRSIGARSVVIRRPASAIEAKTCSLLFVARDLTYRLATVTETLLGRTVIVIAESTELLEQGAMITIGLRSGRLEFHVNHTLIKARGLRMNSDVLALARSVR